jgi:hypothetical protein
VAQNPVVQQLAAKAVQAEASLQDAVKKAVNDPSGAAKGAGEAGNTFFSHLRSQVERDLQKWGVPQQPSGTSSSAASKASPDAAKSSEQRRLK